MYWMLLPPSANVGRHLGSNSEPQTGYWSALFHAGVTKFLAGSGQVRTESIDTALPPSGGKA
jgi:hypothetical protein